MSCNNIFAFSYLHYKFLGYNACNQIFLTEDKAFATLHLYTTDKINTHLQLNSYYILFQLCLDLDHNNCNYSSNYYHIHCSQTMKYKRWSRRSKVQTLCCPKYQNLVKTLELKLFMISVNYNLC